MLDNSAAASKSSGRSGERDARASSANSDDRIISHNNAIIGAINLRRTLAANGTGSSSGGSHGRDSVRSSVRSTPGEEGEAAVDAGGSGGSPSDVDAAVADFGQRSGSSSRNAELGARQPLALPE